MTKRQAIRAFVSFVCENKMSFARDKFSNNNWAMDISGNHPRLKTPIRWDMPEDEMDKMFRKDFVKRCNMAKGFSSIVLALLHECGHWATRSVIDTVEYTKQCEKAVGMEMYLAIPYERIATEWAICWLNCPANRKVAKQFEKVYFGH